MQAGLTLQYINVKCAPANLYVLKSDKWLTKQI